MEKEIPARTKNSHLNEACHSTFPLFHCFYNVAVVIVCKHPCKNVYGITFLKSTFCQTSTELSFHGLMAVNWWAEEVRLTLTRLLFKTLNIFLRGFSSNQTNLILSAACFLTLTDKVKQSLTDINYNMHGPRSLLNVLTLLTNNIVFHKSVVQSFNIQVCKTKI